ncbi:MAG: 16S rRNA (adenine(1518)-N(6)/adenine(1519)-N(6))-dimethyltransferase RsmA [Bacteroidetes bacterium]|nr:16S rRNA (adenine(1518)-N(6)/adenine(1519)-N(6))-dimethyltransferase RsmA [Bacteroidota bacterium]
MANVRPKKYLGQHFLVDGNIARKIAGSLLAPTGNVIEVGAGKGILTRILLENKDLHFIAVEIDSESIEYLKSALPESEGKIIHGDFLKLDMKEIFSLPFSVIGNFPYNISSQILFKVLENRDLVTEMVGMFQKEVAERIVAKPGSKIYGILSVLTQAFYTPELLFTVGEQVFYPPPQVKSAVVRLTRNMTGRLECDEKLFFTVVKKAFNQRRKTLRNALKGFDPGKRFLAADMFSLRAERLEVNDFVQICLMIEKTE